MDLQYVEDYVAILNLYSAYAHAADSGDADAYVNCFTPDGASDLSSFVIAWRAAPRLFEELTDNGVIRGSDNLRKVVGAVNFHHVTSNVLIRSIKGDLASASAYFVAFTPDEGRIEHYGRYDDELVRCADGAWRFSLRRDVARYERDRA